MVVLVTGCRSGIGLVTAVEAARRGHVVYAGLRDPSTDADLVRAAAGHDVRPVALDVTVAAEREAVVQHIVDEHGRVDALVNNAGIGIGGFLEQLDEDELRRVFEVNVFGAVAMTRAVLPSMRAQRAGTVVQVSSMSGRMAFPGLGAYSGSKFALEGLSESWRHELAPWGVRVVLVEPGAYRTAIWGRNRRIGRHAADPDSPYAPWVKRLDARFAGIVERQSRDPQQVADRICDLLVHPRPPLRVPVGSDARLRAVVLGVAPFALVEWAIARVMRP